MYISGDNSFLIQQTKGVSAMETPFVLGAPCGARR